MTIRTIMTNEREADAIVENRQHVVFRNSSDHYKAGDIIQFNCIKKGRSIFHDIHRKTYVVTTVHNYDNAPLLEGYQLIDFRAV